MEYVNMSTEEALEQQHFIESQMVPSLRVKVEPGEDGKVEPVFYDAAYHQKRKHGKWRTITPPKLEGAVADTHAHLHMMQSPALSLARATVNDVDFVCCITDPTEDGTVVFDGLANWTRAAGSFVQLFLNTCCPTAGPRVSRTRISVGVHPHNARKFNEDVKARLYDLMADPRVNAVGEIGLDYHYDLSPRDVQRDVFRTQLRMAKEAGLPVALHIREAHDEALQILHEEGFPEAGTLLHCCSLSPEEIAPWIEAGCYIAYGGVVTFTNSGYAREGAKLVPMDRLLTETDAPYMAPVPLRGSDCQPDYVVLTAEYLADLRGAEPGEPRREFLRVLRQNAEELLNRPPTEWQKAHEAQAKANRLKW